MDTEGGCQAYRASFGDRLWRRLGFSAAFVSRPADVEGFAPGYFVTRVQAHLSWLDRLRLLVSGWADIEIVYQTDVEIAQARSFSDFRVLPPGRRH